jgi:hypothetical protein
VATRRTLNRSRRTHKAGHAQGAASTDHATQACSSMVSQVSP